MLEKREIKKIRKDFPFFSEYRNGKPLIYFDNASMTQMPLSVINSLTENYKKRANIQRGMYHLAFKKESEFESTRKLLANFIGAEPSEIIFTKNTTESINLLSNVLSKLLREKGNKIVLSELEHHSNLLPWQELSKNKNFALEFIKINEDLTLDINDAKNKINNDAALLSLTHVSNAIGTRNNIKKLIKIAKKNNALTCIDAAQGIGHFELNIKDLGCDFLAFSSHKVFGPSGAGILYINKKYINRLSPFLFGGGMVKDASLNDSSHISDQKKYEAGTQNIEGAIALKESINYISKIGLKNIEKYNKFLLAYCISKIKRMKGIKIYYSEKQNNPGILSFNLENQHPHDVSSLLDDFNICVRAGNHCSIPLMKKLNIHGTLRISFHFYNTLEEIDYFIECLNKISNLLKNAE